MKQNDAMRFVSKSTTYLMIMMIS